MIFLHIHILVLIALVDFVQSVLQHGNAANACLTIIKLKIHLSAYLVTLIVMNALKLAPIAQLVFGL